MFSDIIYKLNPFIHFLSSLLSIFHNSAISFLLKALNPVRIIMRNSEFGIITNAPENFKWVIIRTLKANLNFDSKCKMLLETYNKILILLSNAKCSPHIIQYVFFEADNWSWGFKWNVLWKIECLFIGGNISQTLEAHVSYNCVI